MIEDWTKDPSYGQLSQQKRKAIIMDAFFATDNLCFGRRTLTDFEIKARVLAEVFCMVFAERSWSEDWIRPPNSHMKLARFEMHDPTTVAKLHGFTTPREAVKAACEAGTKHADTAREAQKEGKTLKDLKLDRGPFEDIEVVYIPGTVSSSARDKIDRSSIYPVSVSSIANVLQDNMFRSMHRPFSMARHFLNCTETRELQSLRHFAHNVCDFCPHLLTSDNVSVLVVSLILPPSKIWHRFKNNGIQIDDTTMVQYKTRCMEEKMGWKTAEDKQRFNRLAKKLQRRVHKACIPHSRPIGTKNQE